jgi:pilus assembly protein Flp/PilA
MIEYVKTWLELKTDKRAVTALEYGMIAALIAAVIVGTVATLGQSINAALLTISGKL